MVLKKKHLERNTPEGKLFIFCLVAEMWESICHFKWLSLLISNWGGGGVVKAHFQILPEASTRTKQTLEHLKMKTQSLIISPTTQNDKLIFTMSSYWQHIYMNSLRETTQTALYLSVHFSYRLSKCQFCSKIMPLIHFILFMGLSRITTTSHKNINFWVANFLLVCIGDMW